MKFTCNRKSKTSSLLSHISESCRLIGAEVRSRFLSTLKKKSIDVGFVFDCKRSRRLMTKFLVPLKCKVNHKYFCRDVLNLLWVPCLACASSELRFLNIEHAGLFMNTHLAGLEHLVFVALIVTCHSMDFCCGDVCSFINTDVCSRTTALVNCNIFVGSLDFCIS